MKPTLWIFELIFGCHHEHLSRAFTIQKRTYKVCVECGREFDYSWARMHTLRPAVARRVYVTPNPIRFLKFW